MNSTYRLDTPNHEVHWHFIPRYKHTITFEGLEFTDPDFGYILRPIEHRIPQNIMNKLMAKIKENLEGLYESNG